MSRKGILIKGSNYLEALNNLDIVVFDKTGTLTKGVFEVTKIIPVNGYTNEKLLEISAKAEVFSTHPIAFSILKAYGKKVDKENILVGNSKFMIDNDIEFNEIDEVGTKVICSS